MCHKSQLTNHLMTQKKFPLNRVGVFKMKLMCKMYYLSPSLFFFPSVTLLQLFTGTEDANELNVEKESEKNEVRNLNPNTHNPQNQAK